MPHTVDDQHLRAVDRFLHILRAAERHQRVFPAVDDDGRGGDVAEPFHAAVARRDAGEQVPAVAGRIEGPVIEASRAVADLRFVSREEVLPLRWEVATASSIAPSRVPDGLRGFASHSATLPCGRGRPRRPDVAMMEAMVAIFSGCRIANVCAMAPPLELPTIWAFSIPSASSRPAASSAMSSSV